MSMLRRFMLILILSSLAVFSAGAEPGFPAGGMAFGLRTIFLDTAAWNARLPSAAHPALPDGPVFMHGGSAYVNINSWFRVGLQGYGIVHGAYEDTAMTELAADMVGFFADFRIPLFWTFTAFGGGTLSCGRFYFNSMDDAGTGLRASSGAVYIEPYVGVGFILLNFFEIRASVSYVLIQLFEDRLWYGPGTPVAVRPDAPIASITLGLPLPSFR